MLMNNEKTMRKKLTAFLTALLVISICHSVLAQAPAATNAPAAAPAPADPTPDPQGYNTGAAVDAADGSNSVILVVAPTDLSADDKKDTNKVATFNTAKKAFDDQQA